MDALRELTIGYPGSSIPLVVAVADRAHRQRHARLRAALAERDGRILRAVVIMMDHATRIALAEPHGPHVVLELLPEPYMKRSVASSPL